MRNVWQEPERVLQVLHAVEDWAIKLDASPGPAGQFTEKLTVQVLQLIL
jgi:hypothetical protein